MFAEARNHNEERLIDYLDDRFQTSSDLVLDNISDLISITAKNQAQLEAQLRDVLAEQEEIRGKVEKSEDELRQKISAFEKKQDFIDHNMWTMNQDQRVGALVKEWEPVMDRIGYLQVAEQYLWLAEEIEKLNDQSDPTNTSASHNSLIEAYTRLYAISDTLQQRQDAADGAAPHLIFRASTLASLRRDQLRVLFSDEVAKSLAKIGWPGNKEARFGDGDDDQDRETFIAALDKLVQLQVPELKAVGREREQKGLLWRQWRDQPPVLFAVDALVQPLKMRFQFHFNTDRITNRIETPELFLDAVLEMISTHEDFAVEYLQPILWSQLAGVTEGGIGEMNCYVNPADAFIAGLIPMVREKLKTISGQIMFLVEDDQDGTLTDDARRVLTHLVDEVLGFDQSLREGWGYEGGWWDNQNENIELEEENGQRSFEWPGLANELLSADNERLFGQWLGAEKAFTLKRYDEIIQNPRAGEIDYDGVDKRSTKPTNAAVQVHDLLEAVTKRYKRVHSFTHRNRFLIEIQVAILDLFFSRLYESHQSFLVLTTTIGRRMQGISREEQAELAGVAGLDQLCRVCGSASFLEDAMKDWSDDVFFLDMYVTMQDRVARRAKHRKSGSVQHSIVADHSQGGGRTPGLEEDIGETESIFDESTQSYRKLRDGAEKTMTETLVSSVKAALTAYAHNKETHYASLGESSGSVGSPTDVTSSFVPARSAHLTPVLELLESHLSFLRKCLSDSPFDRISRAVTRCVDDTIFLQILLAKQFSTHGTMVLRQDLDALVNVLKVVGRVQQQQHQHQRRRHSSRGQTNGDEENAVTAVVDDDVGDEMEVVSDLGQTGYQIIWTGKSGEGYRLLTVPSRLGSHRVGIKTTTYTPLDDPWAEDDEEEEEEQEQEGVPEDGGVGIDRKEGDGVEGAGAGGADDAAAKVELVYLQDLEQNLYKDNDSAAKILTKLDIRRLTIYDARMVLKNRVDLMNP